MSSSRLALATVVAAAIWTSSRAEAAPARPYEGPPAVEAPADADTTTVQTAPRTSAAPATDEADVPKKRAAAEDAAPEVGPVVPSDAAPAPDVSGNPRHSLVYRNLLAARYNPLGLVNELTVSYRLQLIDKPGVLYRDSYAAVSGHAFVNPAFTRIGPVLEVQPLAILNLQAEYDYVGYYSTFDQMMSFPTPTVPYDDTTLEELGEQDINYPTWGHLVTLSALLQAKVKNVAVRDNVKFYFASMKLREGDTVYYDQTLDILEPNNGWVVANDLDLIYLFDFGLKLGARYTVTHAFYQQKHFLPGEPVSHPNGPTHRVGPAILYTFYDKPERRFNRPTLILLSQWWARHRWRTGVDVHAAVPYLAIGFLFEGRLLPDPRSKK